ERRLIKGGSKRRSGTAAPGSLSTTGALTELLPVTLSAAPLSPGMEPVRSLLLLTALLGAAAATEVICYWGSWSHYRTGLGTVTAEDLDPHLCTIYVYSFAKLSPSTYQMEMFDPWLDGHLRNYERFLSLRKRNPSLKLLLALGGWTDSLHPKYSIMLASPALRASFTAGAVQFLQQHGFDGLDLDYEYPSAADRAGFAAWVTELRAAFQPHGLLLTAAVTASAAKIDAGYDVPAVSAALDFINVMAYDLHGPWEATADHHAPLLPRASDAGSGLDLQSVMEAWRSRGAPASKLAVGVPLYGKSWTVPGADKGPPAAGRGAARAGPVTREAGTLSYLEICHNVRAGWSVVTDPAGKIGPYAYSGDQWVGYDDTAMVAAKTRWAVSQGFGAVMVWDVSYEDVRNTCGGGAWPLMSAIVESLGSAGPSNTTTTSTTSTTSTTTSTSSTTSTTAPSPTEGGPAPACSASGGAAPDPRDCATYVLCAGGAAHTFRCPQGTLFDPSRGYCNWASLVRCSAAPEGGATATVKPSTAASVPAPPAPTSTPAPSRPFTCPSADGWFADPEDCHRFYKCLSGAAHRAACPAGTGWNQAISSCDWAARVGCV
ncbi:acidic mammalian chitinase-like, partial [Amphibalanus amphitrite]|uniref:acidic mammalian chitinase-like n=1 Tax=Amphibalanus amphitrite TaxID=1232801 RepID=UPI001C928802